LVKYSLPVDLATESQPVREKVFFYMVRFIKKNRLYMVSTYVVKILCDQKHLNEIHRVGADAAAGVPDANELQAIINCFLLINV